MIKKLRDCNDLELAIRAETIDNRVLRRGYPLHEEIILYHGISRELQRKNSPAAPLYTAKANTTYAMR